MFKNGGLPGQILQNWSTTATLAVKIGLIPVREPIFRAGVKRNYISAIAQPGRPGRRRGILIRDQGKSVEAITWGDISNGLRWRKVSRVFLEVGLQLRSLKTHASASEPLLITEVPSGISIRALARAMASSLALWRKGMAYRMPLSYSIWQ